MNTISRPGRGAPALALTLFAWLLLAGPAAAQVDPPPPTAQELQQQIELLQQQVQALTQEVQTLRQQQAVPPPPPPAPPAQPPAPAAPPRLPAPQLYGFIQSQFEDVQSGESRFFQRRVRFGFRSASPGDFAYAFNLEAGTSGANMRDGWIRHTLGDAGSVRLGQYKLPFALEGLESGAANPTIERSYATGALYHFRDIGLEYASPRGPGSWLHATAGIFNGGGQNQFAARGDKVIAGRLVVQNPEMQPLLGGQVALGLSAQAGDGFDTAGRRTGETYAVDAQYRNDRFMLRGEWLTGKRDHVRPEGWYVLGLYRLRDNLEGVLRYDVLDHDLPGMSDARRTTVGVNHHFSPFTKLMLNYEFVSGDPPVAQGSGLRLRLQTLLN